MQVGWGFACGVSEDRERGNAVKKIGGGFKYFLWKIPILTSIFFKWVETTN